jgi:hypothetical protein
MTSQGTISRGTIAHRALAVLGCAALLFFAAGGTYLHQHQGGRGPDTVCHVCQALHMPALAAASLDLVIAPGPITWHSSILLRVAPEASFALHRASRAPPVA